MKVNHFLVAVFLLVFISTKCSSAGFCVGTKTNGITQNKLYENKRFGFVLQIPTSWEGYYIINESNKNYVEVSFVGESKTSKNIDVDSNKICGLTLFYIANEAYVKNRKFIDGAKEIGSSHKVKYYYFTNSDYPIGALYDVFNNSEIKDDEEKLKAYNDYLEAKQMEKDIEGIIKSFKAKY